MKKEQGGFLAIFLLVLLIIAGSLYFRYQSISTVTDKAVIETLHRQLTLELKSGDLKGLFRSFDQGSLSDMASKALSLIHREIVIVDVQAGSPLLRFDDQGETLFRIKFNVEESNKILATDVHYLRYEKPLGSELRYRGKADQEAFFSSYFTLP